MIHLFHKWLRVEDIDHSKCGTCFLKEWWQQGSAPYCTHSIRFCIKCGKIEAWGSHGKFHLIPSTCPTNIKEQFDEARKAFGAN
jgi:hypothetical protein